MAGGARAVLLVLLVAALPLRAVASVTAVFCATGGPEAPVQAHGHAHAGGEHAKAHGSEQPSGALGHDCGFCTSHCGSSAYALVPDAPQLVLAERSHPIPFRLQPIAGFVPDHLERPPLAL